MSDVSALGRKAATSSAIFSREQFMEYEGNLFEYLVNAIAMTIIFCGFFGLAHRVSSVIFAICAYPVYLSLYYFELFSTKLSSSEKQFFKLNIPKGSPQKYFMNFVASFVTLGLLPNVFSFYAIIQLPPEQQAMSMVGLMFGSSDFQIWHNSVAIVAVLGVYLISYWSERDDKHPMEKIDQLSVPSLWKSTLKI